MRKLDIRWLKASVASVLLLSTALSQAIDFEYTKDATGVTITRYTGSLPSVIVPDLIEDLPVLQIGYNAFYNIRFVTNIVIPNSVGAIGVGAFQNTSIKSFTIPEGVTNLSAYAFYCCSDLVEVTIPDTVTSLGSQPFGACSSLLSIRMPEQTTFIGRNDFQLCRSLTNVTLPNGLKEIRAYAFQDCNDLPSITIPNSVTNIDTQAFAYCYELNGIYFEGAVPDFAAGDMFLNSTSVTVFHLPNSSGWTETFALRPTALWMPEIARTTLSDSRIDFDITWSGDFSVTVETKERVATDEWEMVGTVDLQRGFGQFSHPVPVDEAQRFFRVKWQGSE